MSYVLLANKETFKILKDLEMTGSTPIYNWFRYKDYGIGLGQWISHSDPKDLSQISRDEEVIAKLDSVGLIWDDGNPNKEVDIVHKPVSNIVYFRIKAMPLTKEGELDKEKKFIQVTNGRMVQYYNVGEVFKMGLLPGCEEATRNLDKESKEKLELDCLQRLLSFIDQTKTEERFQNEKEPYFGVTHYVPNE